MICPPEIAPESAMIWGWYDGPISGTAYNSGQCWIFEYLAQTLTQSPFDIHLFGFWQGSNEIVQAAYAELRRANVIQNGTVVSWPETQPDSAGGGALARLSRLGAVALDQVVFSLRTGVYASDLWCGYCEDEVFVRRISMLAESGGMAMKGWGEILTYFGLALPRTVLVERDMVAVW